MYITKERVGASRTDCEGKLRLTAAIDMIQDCSMFWMESEPSFHEFIRGGNLGMFLVFRQVDVVRMPVYGEKLTVATSIYGCKGFFGHRNTVIYDEMEKPCVLTWSIGAFVDLDGGRMARLPKEEIGKVLLEDPVPMEYLDKRIALPDMDAFSSLEPLLVARGDIDMHRHVNNARYLHYAHEMLPEGFRVCRVRIDYKRPATRGCTLYPRIAGEGELRWIALDGVDGEHYTVMEFAGEQSR